jgi:hypothetical protein
MDRRLGKFVEALVGVLCFVLRRRLDVLVGRLGCWIRDACSVACLTGEDTPQLLFVIMIAEAVGGPSF